MKQHLKDWALGLFAVLLLSLDTGCGAAEQGSQPEPSRFHGMTLEEVRATIVPPADIDLHPAPLVVADEAPALHQKSLSDCGSVSSDWEDFLVAVDSGTGQIDANAWQATNRCSKYGPIGADTVTWKTSIGAGFFNEYIDEGIELGVEAFIEGIVGRNSSRVVYYASNFDVQFTPNVTVENMGFYKQEQGEAELVFPLNGGAAGTPAQSAIQFTTKARIVMNPALIVAACEDEFPDSEESCQVVLSAAIAQHELAHFWGMEHNSGTGDTFQNSCGVTTSRRSHMLSAEAVVDRVCGSFAWSQFDLRRSSPAAIDFPTAGGVLLKDEATGYGLNGWCVGSNCDFTL